MERICIYGCGKIGKEAIIHYKNVNDMELSFLCDSDSDKWGQIYQGIEIMSPQVIEEHEKDLSFIVIATAYVDEVVIKLGKMGIDPAKIRIYKSDSNHSRKISEVYRNRSWSQDGEDIYLQERFGNKKGFYVDVGALHPFRFSNTAWAYEKGWTGINIEPNINHYNLFEVLRPKDININCGISDVRGEMVYYCYEESALNGFDVSMHSEFPVVEERIIECRKLSDIFNAHKVKRIDFLDIDVEGLEMNVLKSIDFSVDIECILLEQHVNADLLYRTAEYQFLKKKGFNAVAKYGRTAIYEKNYFS